MLGDDGADGCGAIHRRASIVAEVRWVQPGARRHGSHGIHGTLGNVVSVSYRFHLAWSGSNPTLSAKQVVTSQYFTAMRSSLRVS